jgi:hypothetical protein
MAKADRNNTTTWISLLDARALVVRAYGATQRAERLLVEWLGERRVRWSCKLLEGPSASELAALQRGQVGSISLVADAAYSDGDPAFWRTNLEINWEEGWARAKRSVVGGTEACGIRVVREDVLALLPEEPDEHTEAVTGGASKTWITAEARRMKATGEIPPTISKFARLLARRMDKAATADRSIRPIEWESIRNKLGEWDLWPATSIK